MKKLIFISCTLFFFSSAHASLYFNPGLEIGFSGSFEQGSSELDLDGNPIIGDLQIGWGSLGLSIGLDYEMSFSDLSFENNSGTTTTDRELTAYGIFVGYEFPVMFRIFGSYMLSGTADDSSINSELGDMSGMKFGLGYTGFPLFTINLTMRNYTFGESNDVVLTNDVDISLTTIGVSFPINM